MGFNRRKKRKELPDWLAFIIAVILWTLPLIGGVVALIYQINIQQEMYGFWSEHIHIWGLYDLWNLTLFGYIPLFIWIES